MFDTLTYAQELKEAGLPDKQATVHAKAFLRITEEKLASKEDLALLKQELKQDLTLVKQELSAKIDAQGKDTVITMLKWIVPLLIAQTGLMVALIKML